MTKKSPSPPKTAFYKVTTTIEGDPPITDAVVVEASSWSDAAALIAAKHITVEQYPVDKLVAYIQAGGVPIKVPPKAKRAYNKRPAKQLAPESSPA